MKAKFFSEVPLLSGTPNEIPAGTVIGVLEVPDAVKLDANAVINAIARGVATTNEPPKKAEKPENGEAAGAATNKK